MSNDLQKVIDRERAKLARQKDAVRSTEAMIALLEKELAHPSKSK